MGEKQHPSPGLIGQVAEQYERCVKNGTMGQHFAASHSLGLCFAWLEGSIAQAGMANGGLDLITDTCMVVMDRAGVR